ncbi:MAG: hypothetical protein HQL51_12120 [Magnetococcales bacterium]|nr:hypothetical protein [Magnetococcales bacterium]
MIVPLKLLDPGMRLENDVRDLSGRLLLAAGEAVEARHLRIFKMWGVTEADVVPPEGFVAGAGGAEGMTEARSELLRMQRAELDDLFRFVDRSHPVMAELVAWTFRRMAPR